MIQHAAWEALAYGITEQRCICCFPFPAVMWVGIRRPRQMCKAESTWRAARMACSLVEKAPKPSGLHQPY